MNFDLEIWFAALPVVQEQLAKVAIDGLTVTASPDGRTLIVRTALSKQDDTKLETAIVAFMRSR